MSGHESGRWSGAIESPVAIVGRRVLQRPLDLVELASRASSSGSGRVAVGDRSVMRLREVVERARDRGQLRRRSAHVRSHGSLSGSGPRVRPTTVSACSLALDLRGAPATCAPVLPRPAAGGGDAGSWQSVRGILADVRAGGDGAVRELHRALRRRAARRPRAFPTTNASARSTPSRRRCATPWRRPPPTDRRLPPRSRWPDRHLRARRRASSRTLHRPVDRAGLLRAGRAGRLSVHRADDRRAGAGRRRRRGRAVRAARSATGAVARRRRWRPPRSPASTRCTAVGGAQAIGAMAYGTESIRAGRRDRRARATSTSRSPNARSPARAVSACRPRSPDRRRSWSSPTTRRPPSSPPST